MIKAPEDQHLSIFLLRMKVGVGLILDMENRLDNAENKMS